MLMLNPTTQASNNNQLTNTIGILGFDPKDATVIGMRLNLTLPLSPHAQWARRIGRMIPFFAEFFSARMAHRFSLTRLPDPSPSSISSHGR